MPSREPLSNEQIEGALADLQGWSYEDDALNRSFEFSDFRAAVSFIVRMAFYAEEMNHHPDLHNVYNTVDLALSTHDAGGKVTGMDVELARKINQMTNDE